VGDRTARVVVVSATGTPFCIQRTPTGVTYGSSLGREQGSGRGRAGGVWFDAVVRRHDPRVPVPGDVRRSRPAGRLPALPMVQALIVQTLRTSNPDT
jgi:hypothetical protein